MYFGWEAGAVLGELLRGPRGRSLHCRQQWLLFVKPLLVLAHLNSVRQVLLLCLFADKETELKKSSVICPTAVIKWRSQDSNLQSSSKPAPFNQLLHKLYWTCSWDKPFKTNNPRARELM